MAECLHVLSVSIRLLMDHVFAEHVSVSHGVCWTVPQGWSAGAGGDSGDKVQTQGYRQGDAASGS